MAVYTKIFIPSISRGFYFGKFEVTRQQWETVMGPHEWVLPVRDCPQCPVINLLFSEVEEFISRLNQTNEDGQFRLPTEAEWEYVARAGTTTRWSFGDDETELTNYAWYGENSGCNPHIVGICGGREGGLKLPNPWGLYDMYGNVSEWCIDWAFREYTGQNLVDPVFDVQPEPLNEPPALFPGRITRGGSIESFMGSTGSASRDLRNPLMSINITGIRLVFVPNVPTSVKRYPWGHIKNEQKGQ